MKLKKEHKIGLFAILIIAGTYFLINFLRGKDLFNKKNEFYAIYESVDGIAKSGPVYIRGLKVGIIEKITYDQVADRFIVKFSVNSSYSFGNASVAELYSSDILGGKAIRIDLKESASLAVPGDTLASAVAPDLVSMLTTELMPIKDQASVLLVNLNTAVTNINEILDTDTKSDITAAISSLRKTAENAEKITSSLNGKMPEIDEFISNLNKLGENLSNTGEDMESSMNNINEVTRQIREAQLQETLTSLGELIDKIQQKDNSVGMLLNDPSLHDNLTRLIKSADSLVTKISENPKKYLKISVF